MEENKDNTQELSINTENLEKINKIKDLLQSENSDLFEILSLREKIVFNDKNEEDQINNDIWQKQYNSLFPETSININIPTKINLNMINLLLSSADKYKIKDTEKINQIKNIQEEANNYIKQIKKIKSLEDLNNFKQRIENLKIDLNEYIIQREMKLKNKILDESDEGENKDGKDNTTNNNKEIISKPKTHRKKKYKRKEDEYEDDFVEDGSESSENGSEKIDLSNHVIDLGKKKSGTNIKRIADELQEEAKNFISMRSRRNITRKKDNDYIYDDIYDKKNESNNSKNNSNINSENEEIIKSKKKNIDFNEDEDYTEEEVKIKEKKHKVIYNENLLNDIKPVLIEKKSIKTNPTNKIVALNSNEENKIKSRKNALSNITKILTDNKYLIEEGSDFVNALANRVEEDLAKAYPAIDFDYQKTLSNMNKTLKEISKYKRINQMIIKGKITLFKMAKFQYGDKFIQKLKKVEEGGGGKKTPKPKNESFSFGDLLQDSNINDDKRSNNDKNRLSLMKSSSNLSYRSGFSKSSFGEERSGDFGIENEYYSKTQTGTYSNRFDNDDSLESIEDQQNIKFSPGINNRSNRDISGNLEEDMGHAYDPFNKEKIDYNNLFPILYDPSLDISSKEEKLNDQDLSSPNFNNDSNLILANPPPTGSILRIFHGKIRLNHNTLDNASLFSVNRYQNFLKFPSFEKELILPSKAKSNEVIPYCLKQWIEPDLNKNQENIEITKFRDLIEEFERNEKCSCLVENKIKLYIFVLGGEKDEKLFKKIIKDSKFVNKKLMQNLNNGNKYLVFVLLANNDDLENESIKKKKKIIPEIIKKVEKSESDDESNSFINKKKNLDVIMEEEDENIKNAPFKKNNNNNEYRKIDENDNNNNNNINNNYEKEDDNNENNDEDDEDSCIDKEENEKLKNILEQNDFNAINIYIENNFKDLPLEEMASKLQRFTAENREKLLEIIKNYSENFLSNENQMDIEEDNNMNNSEGNINNMNNNMNQINQQMNNNGGMLNQINMNPSLQMNIYQNDPSLNQMYINQMNNINIQHQPNNNINNNTNLASMYYNQNMNIYNRYNNNFK